MNTTTPEFDEIFSKEPSKMATSGIYIISLFLILLIILSFVIKYPEIVPGECVVTSKTPYVKVVSKSSGEIIILNKKENEFVKKGELIAQIKSTTSAAQINELHLLVDKIDKDVSNHHFVKLSNNYPSFGEMQDFFNQIYASYNAYCDYLATNNNGNVKNNISQQLTNLTESLQLTNSQIAINEIDLAKAEEKFRIEKELYKTGNYSKFEIIEKENILNRNKLALKDAYKTRNQTNMSILELKRQLIELSGGNESERLRLENELKISINSLKSKIDNWQNNYFIEAPIDGKLVYLDKIFLNKNIEISKELFAIMPKNDQYFVEASISRAQISKVSIGQKVKIKINGFPFQEFGVLEGKVNHISAISQDEKIHKVSIQLINGLESDVHKKFDFIPEMQGTAEIITKDYTIFQRLIYRFKSAI
ncbi:MAG: HlyD family efflux transporter periplasmic adaptor subunit [Bacteroidetes bacterium]|nr:HlyD family efflux transporter periplasmic adaptor subunit [Bacteroidota bacterium]